MYSILKVLLCYTCLISKQLKSKSVFTVLSVMYWDPGDVYHIELDRFYFKFCQ